MFFFVLHRQRHDAEQHRKKCMEIKEEDEIEITLAHDFQ